MKSPAVWLGVLLLVAVVCAVVFGLRKKDPPRMERHIQGGFGDGLESAEEVLEPELAESPSGRAAEGLLGPAEIKRGIRAVVKQIYACRQLRPGVTGTVKVRCTIDQDGEMTEAEVDQTPDATLGACVANALRAARFPASGSTTSFTYPVRF